MEDIMIQLSREDILRIPAMVNEGKPLKEIAVELGSTIRTISKWIKKLRETGHEVKTRVGRPPITL